MSAVLAERRHVYVSGTCQSCGTPFIVAVSKHDATPTNYCSDTCKRRAKKQRRKPESPCPACGRHKEADSALCQECVALVNRMCAGKIAYDSFAHAQGVANLLKEERRAGRRPSILNAYRCPVCDQWHIGHRPNGSDGRIGRAVSAYRSTRDA